MTLYSSKIFLTQSSPSFYAGSGLWKFYQNIRDYIQYRNTVRELGSLTDRELDDIGVSRSDIRAIAKGEFRR
ncbi:DUF1127 domain-containing protein [Sneathiella glossodoripedis]|uniref:DUF1127 domain-containing protein n=1 Tax=Sneathiella glossodoripedis TaxID=418853 RepID=UPI000471CD7B|nr:DUF1127 domain-containing protein [Sneathiella glossodoripedis]